MWTIDREATAMRGRRREFFAGSLSLAAAWVLAPLPALADNSGRPMTFEWGVVYGDQPAIFADGDFTPETPAAFRSFLQRSAQPTRDRSIYFNSLGGDLSAGMELGRLVRRAGCRQLGGKEIGLEVRREIHISAGVDLRPVVWSGFWCHFVDRRVFVQGHSRLLDEREGNLFPFRAEVIGHEVGPRIGGLIFVVVGCHRGSSQCRS
jgi:hypothetical protein